LCGVDVLKKISVVSLRKAKLKSALQVPPGGVAETAWIDQKRLIKRRSEDRIKFVIANSPLYTRQNFENNT
jgi:hypothetical protein